jgi:hypothetical protein
LIFLCEGVRVANEMTAAIKLMASAVEETQAALLAVQSITADQCEDAANLRRSIDTVRNHLTRANAQMLNVELMLAGYRNPKIG